MNRLQKTLLFCAVALASGCDVFRVEDSEGTRGRGAKAFDPYSSSASGAISLSLLGYNGCSMLPNGEPVALGGSLDPSVFDYPATCERPDMAFAPGPVPPIPPFAQMNVTPGALYFLREFSVVNSVFNQHTDFNDRTAPAKWIRKQSRFKNLDWSGMTMGRDEWRTLNNRGLFQRETYFENAAWMLSNEDEFKLEVLDEAGNIRVSETYKRTDFLAENPVTGRTRVSWMAMGIERPQYPGDITLHMSDLFGPPMFQTVVKVSMVGSTNPFKSFRMPDLTGEGVIRITWSLLPDEPFLFPVNFVKEQDRAPTCYKLGADGLPDDSQPVPCGFGLQQTVKIAPPANGKFHTPGETVDFQLALLDGDGNALHPRDTLPSFNEYMGDMANGLLYFNDSMLFPFRDASASEAGYKVIGPLHDLQVVNGTYEIPYFAFPQSSEPKYYLDPGSQYYGGGGDIHPATRLAVKLPANAKPGTYSIMLKGHRYFMGERLNRLDSFFFQVGQEQATTYPGVVGNCQVCHNGVNSMTNVHHGVAVDHVESCKTCHNDESIGFLPDAVHRIHMSSRKYNQDKGDCTLCHLTRESTLRPSIKSCNGCHPGAHGTEYFDLEFQPVHITPNAYGNCANGCHALKPPTSHNLPRN
ncbi:hypothetical protein [Archangium violaceum]|uniref:Uncharacterized protein n=1 Tax=Archangium violaceum Cb vi76 TaxID=1406225 RepID=A0A084SS52_9BACT|nr:hypothetical protein [Archangium violaceum]KFA91287.1 hypothetical protein Q664_22975 [Archangium violaceum Cb vi76]